MLNKRVGYCLNLCTPLIPTPGAHRYDNLTWTGSVCLLVFLRADLGVRGGLTPLLQKEN